MYGNFTSGTTFGGGFVHIIQQPDMRVVRFIHLVNNDPVVNQWCQRTGIMDGDQLFEHCKKLAFEVWAKARFKAVTTAELENLEKRNIEQYIGEPRKCPHGHFDRVRIYDGSRSDGTYREIFMQCSCGAIMVNDATMWETGAGHWCGSATHVSEISPRERVTELRIRMPVEDAVETEPGVWSPL